MLEQPPDVVQRLPREQAVALEVVHQVLAALPERLVDVHAGPVLLVKRLRHVRGALSGLPRHVLHHVLGELDLVGHPEQRVEAQVDLRLTRRAHLVVVELAMDPHRLE